MIFLSVDDVLYLHDRLITESGGSPGLRERGSLESAVAQPRMTFGGEDLYPTLVEKASALGFSLVCNHAFVDGNKRIGQMAMEAFLRFNGHEIGAPKDDQKATILNLASGTMSREEFTAWIAGHLIPRQPGTTS
jgi:death-on-curing protein